MKFFKKSYLSLLLMLFMVPFVNSESMVYTFTTDTGYYFATSHEGKITMTNDLMKKEHIENIPYSLGQWRGYELEHNDENIVFFRAYTHDTDEDAKIYFIAVHGYVESRFHTAEVCYTNDNWRIRKRGFIKIPSGEKQFEARYFTARHNEWKHLLVYFYMWHDSRRLMNEGCVMFRIGVRMTSIDEEKAREYALDFIHHLSNISKKGEVAVQKKALPQADLKLTNPSSPYYGIRKKAIQWLSNQIVPNNVVPSPANNRRNLILSYELPKNAHAYKYIFSKSSLYDNGVAVIAFSIERQYEQASRIIDAIMRMGGEDGELFFTFNTHNTWPSKDDNWGAIIRSGASAWAGQSIVFYLRARLLDDPGVLKKDSELQAYLNYAKIIADKMLTRMVEDKDDARYGLITGGMGTYVFQVNPEINQVEEKFVPGEVSWCSIEHNIDMYFFLRDLGKVSGATKYTNATELMGKRLIAQCWNEKEWQFNRGQSPAKEDTVMALDCASWGTLFLLSRGKNALAQKALTSTGKYENIVNDVKGYKPYRKKLIYEQYNVGKHYFSDKPKKTWNDVNMMWTEGALGVALAYIRAGNKEKTEEILNNVLTYQVPSGGIRYGSLYIPHEFSTEPSVASSGWLIILTGILEDNPIAKLFWD